MAKDFRALEENDIQIMLAKAWDLARFVYPDEDDAECFMENSHKETLGLKNTLQELETPEDLISNYGEDGFDKVEDALLSVLKNREPRFFNS